jgi:hypothetical protein
MLCSEASSSGRWMQFIPESIEYSTSGQALQINHQIEIG